MKPVQLVIPSGTILSPSHTAAVVGGNVLTTQRIVDVIFRAFETCAASQVNYCLYFTVEDTNKMWDVLAASNYRIPCQVKSCLTTSFVTCPALIYFDRVFLKTYKMHNAPFFVALVWPVHVAGSQRFVQKYDVCF